MTTGRIHIFLVLTAFKVRFFDATFLFERMPPDGNVTSTVGHWRKDELGASVLRHCPVLILN